MSKTIKGSFAALAAASLLLGGAGSLAYWNATADLPAGTISSGQLLLTNPNCGTWKIDGGAAFDASTAKIVPGDSLTRDCTVTLTASGTHLGADLTLSTGTPGFTTTPAGGNGLTAEINATAAITTPGNSRTHITSADAGTLVVTETVNFPGTAATNASQNLSATLNSVRLTATQTHDGSPTV